MKYGLNQLPQKNNSSALKILLRQIKNPLFYLLVGATFLSLVVGDKLDAGLIGAILVLNTILGFWQEYKASKELEALRKLEVEYARVIRNGKQVKIPSSEIVQGDIVFKFVINFSGKRIIDYIP